MTPEEIAAEVLPDPYKSSTRQALRESAEVMISHGMPPEVARDTMTALVDAIREEYGE